MRHILTILLTAISIIAEAASYSYNASSGVIFSWDNADVSCVYTTANDRIKMWVSSIGTDKHDVTWTGYGWALNTDNDYYAYYPYNANYVINGNNYTALPISYTGQTQTGNGSTTHLAAYDYMSGQYSAGSGDCHFDLTHLGAMLRIACKMPTTANVNSLTLTSTEDIFTTSATMNVATNAVTPTAKEKELSLTLSNTTVTAGGYLIAYMMVNVTPLSGKCITATIETDANSYEMKFTMPTAEHGVCYAITGEAMVASQAKPSGLLNATKAKAKSVISDEDMTTSSIVSYPTAYAPDFTLKTVQVNILKGDVNNDGVVNILDVACLTSCLINNTTSTLNMSVCDMNNDNEINITDTKAIASKCLSGK